VVTLLLIFRFDARPTHHGAANVRGYPRRARVERCGVKVEILGFTTRAWKAGNRVRRGSPPATSEPGRLNICATVIYKSGDAPGGAPVKTRTDDARERAY